MPRRMGIRAPFVPLPDPENLQPREKVHRCAFTGEVFRSRDERDRALREYEKKEWVCCATGKNGLTFEEALASEKRIEETVLNPMPELLRDCLLIFTHNSKEMPEGVFRQYRDAMREKIHPGVKVQISKGSVPARFRKLSQDPFVVESVKLKDNTRAKRAQTFLNAKQKDLTFVVRPESGTATFEVQGARVKMFPDFTPRFDRVPIVQVIRLLSLYLPKSRVLVGTDARMEECGLAPDLPADVAAELSDLKERGMEEARMRVMSDEDRAVRKRSRTRQTLQGRYSRVNAAFFFIFEELLATDIDLSRSLVRANASRKRKRRKTTDGESVAGDGDEQGSAAAHKSGDEGGSDGDDDDLAMNDAEDSASDADNDNADAKSTTKSADAESDQNAAKYQAFRRNVLRRWSAMGDDARKKYIELAEKHGENVDVLALFGNHALRWAFIVSRLAYTAEKRDAMKEQRRQARIARERGQQAAREEREAEREKIREERKRLPLDEAEMQSMMKNARAKGLAVVEFGGESIPVFSDAPLPVPSQFSVPSSLSPELFPDAMMVWDFVNIFCDLLMLSPYSVDDFLACLDHKEPCVMYEETIMCLLSLVMGKFDDKKDDIFSSDDEDDDEDDEDEEMNPIPSNGQVSVSGDGATTPSENSEADAPATSRPADWRALDETISAESYPRVLRAVLGQRRMRRRLESQWSPPPRSLSSVPGLDPPLPPQDGLRLVFETLAAVKSGKEALASMSSDAKVVLLRFLADEAMGAQEIRDAMDASVGLIFDADKELQESLAAVRRQFDEKLREKKQELRDFEERAAKDVADLQAAHDEAEKLENERVESATRASEEAAAQGALTMSRAQILEEKRRVREAIDAHKEALVKRQAARRQLDRQLEERRVAFEQAVIDVETEYEQAQFDQRKKAEDRRYRVDVLRRVPLGEDRRGVHYEFFHSNGVAGRVFTHAAGEGRWNQLESSAQVTALMNACLPLTKREGPLKESIKLNLRHIEEGLRSAAHTEQRLEGTFKRTTRNDPQAPMAFLRYRNELSEK